MPERPQTPKLVILDGDGTLYAEDAEFTQHPDQWHPLPGALEAVARLNHAGWHVVLASNQPGLGRGVFEVGALNAVHARMHKVLAGGGARLDAVFYCPHTPEEGCRCRKPAPGLFEQIGERFGIELKGMPAVGDTLEDAQAALAAGCVPHLVLTGRGAGLRGKALPSEYPAGTQVHADLAAFADQVIGLPTMAASAVVDGGAPGHP
jgi:D-glycero-D-manno-heptose 1,7-bisphosphate phosphatase